MIKVMLATCCKMNGDNETWPVACGLAFKLILPSCELRKWPRLRGRDGLWLEVGRLDERGRRESVKDRRGRCIKLGRRRRMKRGSSAGMGFIKGLSSLRALPAKVMTSEFRRAVAEGKTIIHQTLASRSHSRRWPRNMVAWRGSSLLFNLDV